MGIIQRQAVKGTIFSYVGVVVGFVTNSILQPYLLTPAQIGVLRLLNSYSNLFAIFFSLGLPSITIKMFPYFKDKEKGHHGFLFNALVATVLGFILATIAYFLLHDYLISTKGDGSAYFAEFIVFVIPLTFFTLLFNAIDAYARSLFNAVAGTLFKELVQRILILVTLLLIFLKLVNFDSFVWFYVAAICLPAVLIIITVISMGEWHMKADPGFLKKDLVKEMSSVGLFGLLAGTGTIMIREVDSIMIKDFVGLDATGIYSVLFYFGVLVSIPARSLRRIAGAVVADSWKENNMENIAKVYHKSCLTQFIIGLYLFLGLWLNQHNIFKILPADKGFELGYHVVTFIALSQLLQMLMGASTEIIGTSRHYKFNLPLVLFFVACLILFNFLFIPMYGLNGAALASAVSAAIYSLARFTFLYVKFKLQPFNSRFLLAILIGGISALAVWFIPALDNFIFDIILRAGIITVVFFGLTVVLHVSEDINDTIRGILSRFGKKR